MPGTTSNAMPAALQRLGLLAAAAEHERVPALEPHDLAPGAPCSHQQRLDLVLADRGPAALLAGVDQLGVRRARRPGRWPGSGGRRRSRRRAAISSQRPRGHQPRVARARPRPGRRSSRPPSLGLARAARRAPAASMRSAQSRPEPRRASPVTSSRQPRRAVGQPDPARVSSTRPAAGRGACAPTGVWQVAPSAWTSARSAASRPSRRVRHAAQPLGVDRARRAPRAPVRPGRPPGRARPASPPASCSRPSRDQPGAGEHERVGLALGELAQPGVDVAAQLHDLQVGAQRAQLRGPAQAAGPDPAPAAGSASSEWRAADRVPGVGARSGTAHELEAGIELGRARPWPSARRRRCGPSSSARSSSETQRDLSSSSRAAVAQRGDRDDLHLGPAAPRRSATHRAWVSASALPRVPSAHQAWRRRARGQRVHVRPARPAASRRPARRRRVERVAAACPPPR